MNTSSGRDSWSGPLRPPIDSNIHMNTTYMKSYVYVLQTAIYRDLDYDGLTDTNEAASMAAVRAASKPPVRSAEATQDERDAALLRSINGRKDNWGEEMYTVVNMEDSGYLL
jgi:hypothetical protein